MVLNICLICITVAPQSAFSLVVVCLKYPLYLVVAEGFQNWWCPVVHESPEIALVPAISWVSCLHGDSFALT